ncbi:MAG: hypothetical protein ABUL72_01445, partial [Armatimonadota bacterium]
MKRLALLLPLLAITTLANAADTVTVGTAASAGNALNGRVLMNWPAGTFSAASQLYVCNNDLVPQVHQLVTGSGVSIGRPGTKFLHPVNLTISYTSESVPTGGSEANLKIARVANGRLQIFNSNVDGGTKRVTAAVTSPGSFCLVSSTSDPAGADQAILRTKQGTYRLHFGQNALTNRSFHRKAFYEKVGTDYSGFYSTLSPTLDSAVTFYQDNFGKLNPYMVNVDGSYPTKLATVNLDEILAVAISPNGKSVAYVGNRGT